MEALKVTFRFITPGFVGGCEFAPELRLTSFKGMLRHAAIAACGLHEDMNAFGSKTRGGWFNIATVGESSVRIMRVTLAPGSGLAYFMLDGLTQREAIAPGEAWTIRFVPRGSEQRLLSDCGESATRTLVASLWVMANSFGVGARWRRGFGALHLDGWEIETISPGRWHGLREAIGQLGLESRASAHAYTDALKVFDAWFGAPRKGDPVPDRMGLATEIKVGTTAHPTWEAALEAAGTHMKVFRARMEPDYTHIKGAMAGAHILGMAPCRAAFGLPLTFRQKTGQRMELIPYVRQGRPTDRMPSPLIVRPVLSDDGGIRLTYAVRPMGDEPAIQARHTHRPLAASGQYHTILPTYVGTVQ